MNKEKQTFFSDALTYLSLTYFTSSGQYLAQFV